MQDATAEICAVMNNGEIGCETFSDVCNYMGYDYSNLMSIGDYVHCCCDMANFTPTTTELGCCCDKSESLANFQSADCGTGTTY